MVFVGDISIVRGIIYQLLTGGGHHLVVVLHLSRPLVGGQVPGSTATSFGVDLGDLQVRSRTAEAAVPGS